MATSDSSPAELGNQGLALEECLPSSFEFLDVYQATTWGQILWDQTEDGGQRGTIKGLVPKQYMLNGLDQEIGEMLVDEDRAEPDYSRLGALVQLPPQLTEGAATPTSVDRHLKEFGDVSWYLANFLRLHNITFARVVTPGLAAWELDRVSQPRSDREMAITLETTMPWIKLAAAARELQQSAHGVMGIPHDERIIPEQRLFIASGKLTLSMIHMATTRFGTTYKDVLAANIAKLEQRMAQGTVFDKTGGDDR